MGVVGGMLTSPYITTAIESVYNSIVLKGILTVVSIKHTSWSIGTDRSSAQASGCAHFVPARTPALKVE